MSLLIILPLLVPIVDLLLIILLKPIKLKILLEVLHVWRPCVNLLQLLIILVHQFFIGFECVLGAQE